MGSIKNQYLITSFLDLCSGIGGGRLGLELCGLISTGYSDTSKLSVRTYKLLHNTLEEPYYYNLKTIKTDFLPPYDLLIAGFPCQSFSVIGKRTGLSDNRGQLIFHIIRILKQTQPKAFILENVRGLVSHDKGKTLHTILNELKEAGFNTTHKILSSIDYGVPQMRQRVFFVGFRNDLNLKIEEFNWPKKLSKPPLERYLIDNKIASDDRLEILQYYLNNPTNKGEYTINDISKLEGKIIDTRMSDLRIYEERCPTLRSQRDGILYVKNKTIHELSGYEALLLQGFPKEYADKVKNLVSDRHLLRQAGNAMTVNVINAIGNSILEFLN